MQSNFPAVMAEVFRHEGGMSTDRGDPGNWTSGKVGQGEFRGTKYGIAAHANPGVDIANLTVAQAREIYRVRYWAKIRGDDLPIGIDLATMDPAVNSGPARGATWLQHAVRVPADGVVGPETLRAAKTANAPDVIQRICALRMGYLRGLRIWGRYAKGWSRRVASIEAVGVAMAVGPQPKALRDLAASAETAGKGQNKAATSTGVAGAGTGAAGLGLPADVPVWVIAAGLAIVAVIIINLIGRARHNRARAEAYAAVAEEIEHA